MANKTQTLRDKKVSVANGRNTGLVNGKPSSVKVKRVKPGYRPEDKLVKPGGN